MSARPTREECVRALWDHIDAHKRLTGGIHFAFREAARLLTEDRAMRARWAETSKGIAREALARFKERGGSLHEALADSLYGYAVDAEARADAAEAKLAEKDERINDLKAERDEYVEAAIRTELAEEERDAAREDVEEVWGLLRRIEWAGGDGVDQCPECGRFPESERGPGLLELSREYGHRDDCLLAAALAQGATGAQAPEKKEAYWCCDCREDFTGLIQRGCPCVFCGQGEPAPEPEEGQGHE